MASVGQAVKSERRGKIRARARMNTTTGTLMSFHDVDVHVLQ